MENLQRLLSDLYYIGKLKEGHEKLNPVYKNIDRGFIASIMRFVFHSKCNREVNFEFVRNSISEAFQALDLYSHKDGEIGELVTYKSASEMLLSAIEVALAGLKVMKANYEKEQANEGFITNIQAYEDIISLKVRAWRERIPAPSVSPDHKVLSTPSVAVVPETSSTAVGKKGSQKPTIP